MPIWHILVLLGLHIANLALANRGHRPRHPNARPRRKLRPVVPNARAELTYKRLLLELVHKCQAAANRALAALQPHWPQPAADGWVGDEYATSTPIPHHLVDAFRKAKLQFGKLLDKQAKQLAGIAVQLNLDSVDQRLARVIREAIGVDVSAVLRANGPLLQSMKSATADNVALIKSIPSQYFDRVYETVTSGWTSGLRWESIVKQVQHDGSVTESRAKLIARDQTSKLNSAFNRERQQQVGIEQYEWSTSQDERVRDSHAELDGKVFRWDSPPVVDGEAVNPGEAIQCRCVALPYVQMEEVAHAAAGVGVVPEDVEER